MSASPLKPARFAEAGVFAASFCPDAAAKGPGSAAQSHSILSSVYRWAMVCPERAPSHPLFVGAVRHGKPAPLEDGGEMLPAEDISLQMAGIAESSKTGVLYVSSLMNSDAPPQEVASAAEKVAAAIVAASDLEVLGSPSFLLSSQNTFGPETLQSLAALALSSSDNGRVDATTALTARPADGGDGIDGTRSGGPSSGGGASPAAGVPVASSNSSSTASPAKRKSGAAQPLKGVFDILGDGNQETSDVIKKSDSKSSGNSDGSSGGSGLSIKAGGGRGMGSSMNPLPPQASPTPLAGLTGHGDHMRPALHVNDYDYDSAMLSPTLGGLVTPAGQTPFPRGSRPMMLATNRTHQHHEHLDSKAAAKSALHLASIKPAIASTTTTSSSYVGHEELAHVVHAEAETLSDGLSSDGKKKKAAAGEEEGGEGGPEAVDQHEHGSRTAESESAESTGAGDRDPDTIHSLPSFAEVAAHLIESEMCHVKAWSRQSADSIFLRSRPPSVTVHSTAPPAPPPPATASSEKDGSATSIAPFSSALPFELWQPYPIQQVVGEPSTAYAVASAYARLKTQQDRERGITTTSYIVAGDSSGGTSTAGLSVYELCHPSLFDSHNDSFLYAAGHEHNNNNNNDSSNNSGSAAPMTNGAGATIPATARVGPSSRPMDAERNAALVALSTATARYRRAEAAGFKLLCASIDDYEHISESFYSLNAIAKGKKDPPAKEIAALQRAYQSAAAAGKTLPHQLPTTPTHASKLTLEQARAEWVNQRSVEIKAAIGNAEIYLLTAPETWLVEKGLLRPKDAPSYDKHDKTKILRKISIGKEREAGLSLSPSEGSSAAGAKAPSPAASATSPSGPSTAWAETREVTSPKLGGSPVNRIRSRGASFVDTHGNVQSHFNRAEDAASTVPRVAVALAVVRGRNPYGARLAEVSVAEPFRKRGFALLLLSMISHRLVSEEAVPSLALFAAEDASQSRLMAKAGFVKRGTVVAVDIIASGVGSGEGCFSGFGHHHPSGGGSGGGAAGGGKNGKQCVVQ